MTCITGPNCNQDRHANNYGLLRDNATGRILGPAPLFDHNMALFKDDMRSDWEAGAWSPDAMNRLQPANKPHSLPSSTL